MEDSSEEERKNIRRIYTVQEYRHRNIPKFGVVGAEYKLAINLQDQQRSYTQVLQLLHIVMGGKSFLPLMSSVTLKIFNPPLFYFLL